MRLQSLMCERSAARLLKAGSHPWAMPCHTACGPSIEMGVLIGSDLQESSGRDA